MSPDLDDRDCATLVALADGLETEDTRRMAARVEADDELRALVAEQRRIATMVRTAAAEERAPMALRTAMRPRRQARRRGPLAAALAGAAALAAALIALVIGGGGNPTAPTLAAVASLAARAPAAAAPSPLPSVDGVRFPDWRRHFGWRATGVRTDRVAGRRTVTVTYLKGGRTVVYSIVAGEPLRWTKLKVVRLDGRTVVTWRRGGRTCVLSARDVPRDKLLGLATGKP
jgi:hypothetical protein